MKSLLHKQLHLAPPPPPSTPDAQDDQEVGELFWKGSKQPPLERLIDRSVITAQQKSMKDSAFAAVTDAKLPQEAPLPESAQASSAMHLSRTGPSGSIPDSSFAAELTSNVVSTLFPPNRAEGKEPSMTSGQLWIAGLRRFVPSGFTNRYIFLKKSRRNQKPHSITIVIDATCNIFRLGNDWHTIATIVCILYSFALIKDCDSIVADVLITKDSSVRLLFENIPVQEFSNPNVLSAILRTCSKQAHPWSSVGAGLKAAFTLASRRSGIGFGRSIIVFTDVLSHSPSDLTLLKQSLLKAEESEIDVIGVGLGLAPVHLPLLFPQCLYTPKIEGLQIALSIAFGMDRSDGLNHVSSQIQSDPVKQDEFSGMKELLFDKTFAEKALEESIRLKPPTRTFLEGYGNRDYLFDPRTGQAGNLEVDPYRDGAFEGFEILIACLYLPPKGDRLWDSEAINIETFDQHCGNALKKRCFTLCKGSRQEQNHSSP